MQIKTFAAEITESSELELYVMYETLTAARMASAHTKKTWTMIANMVEATSEELTKRGLKLPSGDMAWEFLSQSARRAVDAKIDNTHRLETA